MLATLYSVSSLLLGVAVLVAGSGLFGTLLGLRAGREGFGDVVIGLIMSAYFVGFFLGSFHCPAIVRRVGHIRAFAMLAAIASSTAILHALVIDPLLWAALRVLSGACLVGLFMVIESWLNAHVPNERRGQIFSAYTALALGALALGQVLIATADPGGFTLFGVVSILFSLALVPIAFTRVEQPAPVTAPHLGLRRLYATAPAGVVGAFASGLGGGALWGLAPVFVQRIGLDTTVIAGFMTSAVIGGALLQWPIGRISDRQDRRYVLAAICAGAAVLALAALGATYWSVTALVACMFLYGGFAFSVYPVSVAFVNDRLAREHALAGSSGLLLVYGIGAAIGPTLAGTTMALFGPRTLFAYLAVVLSGVAGFAYYRARTAPEPPDATRGQFMPTTVRPSAAALQMVAGGERDDTRSSTGRDADP
jgi:MFS family permease